MELKTMGKVIVPATIENLADLYLAEHGHMLEDQVRKIDVADALVDTGAMMLSLPRRFIQQLGLNRVKTRAAKTPAGVFQFGIYSAIRLTVQGRDCIIDVAEIPDDCPVLIGQLPLESMDWVVDPANQRLIGNPEHGGEHIFELY